MPIDELLKRKISQSLTSKDIRKGCPYLGRGRGLAAIRMQEDKGSEGVQLKVDILFSGVILSSSSHAKD